MGVGFRLKTLLRERNMTIKELSEISGIPKNTLYSITKRDSERVDATVIQAMARVLNVSFEDLAGEERTIRKLLSDGSARSFVIHQIITAAEEARVSKDELLNKAELDTWSAHRLSPTQIIECLPRVEEILNVDAGTFEKKLLEEYVPPVRQRDLLLDAFDTLNPVGQRVAVQRIQELAQIPGYQSGVGIRVGPSELLLNDLPPTKRR